jgi:hypothetical protein
MNKKIEYLIVLQPMNQSEPANVQEVTRMLGDEVEEICNWHRNWCANLYEAIQYACEELNLSSVSDSIYIYKTNKLDDRCYTYFSIIDQKVITIIEYDEVELNALISAVDDVRAAKCISSSASEMYYQFEYMGHDINGQIAFLDNDSEDIERYKKHYECWKSIQCLIKMESEVIDLKRDKIEFVMTNIVPNTAVAANDDFIDTEKLGAAS